MVVVEAEAEAENDNTHYPVSPTVNTGLTFGSGINIREQRISYPSVQ